MQAVTLGVEQLTSGHLDFRHREQTLRAADDRMALAANVVPGLDEVGIGFHCKRQARVHRLSIAHETAAAIREARQPAYRRPYNRRQGTSRTCPSLHSSA